MLRIIAGKYRHMLIDSPNTILTRPTEDKVREAIMSALNYQIENSVVLDLFSGSGALGIEALSRGAKKAYFVDNGSLAIKTIKKNLEKLKIENAEIFHYDYKKALEYFKNEKIKFDLIFLDPPYKLKEVYPYVRKYLLENDLLNKNAILIEESDIKLEEEYGESRYYKYGKVYVKITKEIKV